LSRSVWIDFGNDPSYAVLKAHGITEVVFDIRDPRLTKTYLAGVQAKGLKTGVYAAWNWPETKNLSGPGFATWVDAELKALNISQNVPFVHLNDETHDPVRIVGMLSWWRRIRPKKRTLFTFEGMQGGLYSKADVDALNALAVDYGPQCYTGDMTRMESATVVQDLISHGFDPARIVPFLDAAQLGYWWTGVAYTQGRLP
jgi:hypothetical protein